MGQNRAGCRTGRYRAVRDTGRDGTLDKKTKQDETGRDKRRAGRRTGRVTLLAVPRSSGMYLLSGMQSIGRNTVTIAVDFCIPA